MQELIDYIKKGRESGYSLEHIEQKLIEYGHDEKKVGEAIKLVRFQTNEDKKIPIIEKVPIKINKRKVLLASIIIIVLVAAVFVGYILIKKPGIIAPVSGGKSIETKMTDVERLNFEISEKQRMIEEQISLINNMNISIEEKERLIKEQLDEFQKLNMQIKEERLQLRDMLLDLLNFLISK